MNELPPCVTKYVSCMWLLSDKIYFDLKAFILGRQPCYQSSLFTFFLDAVSISELLDKLVLFLFYYST